jgi:trigger factor
VKATVEPLEGNKVKVSVEVDEQEFESAVDAAFKKIAREVKIPGFRPGKAPRRVLESHIGAGAGRAQALNDSLPEFYSEAIISNDVDVIAPPDIEITGGTDTGVVTFDAVVEIRPVITVEGYADISVEIPAPVATDAEIEEQLERFRNQYATLEVVERVADEGDFVTIDIEGSQNGEVLDGLVASAYLYEVGSAGIVPELDEQLNGVAAGDSLSFEAAHPNGEDEDPLHFEVTVTEVKGKALPDLDDAFAAEASEFETLADWRDDLIARMSEVRKAQAQMAVREKVGEALAELVTDDLPEPLVAVEMNERLQDMAMRLQAQGLTLEQWLQFSGTETDQFLDDLKTTAERSARVDLALRAIAVAESIEVLEEDLETEFAAVSVRVEQPTDVVRTQLTEAGHVPALKVDIAKRKSLDWLTERVAIVDEDGNTIVFADLAVVEIDDDTDAPADVEAISADAEATPSEEGETE